MIYKETIDTWFGIGAPNASVAVLNTDRITTLKARGSGASFNYSVDQADRRVKPTLVWGTTAAATIQASFDSALLTRVMTLNVYPDDDITQSTVAKYIRYKDFIYAYDHDGSNSWVLHEGGRVIVSDTLDTLVSNA